MARQILPIAGQIIGGMIGGPVGAAIGGAIGGAVGQYVDPIRHQGPKLGEARAQTAQEGVYRPLVFGTGCVAGNVIHRSPRKVVRHRESAGGKGNRDTVDSDRGYRTFAIRIAEAHNPDGYQLLRIWENETLVYDVRPESEIPDESAEYAERFRFYEGTQDQLPDPDLEAYLGVGNVNSYRGSCYIVFGNFDLTDYGDMVPQYRFEIASSGESSGTWMAAGNRTQGQSAISITDDVAEWGAALDIPGMPSVSSIGGDGHRIIAYSTNSAKTSIDNGYAWEDCVGLVQQTISGCLKFNGIWIMPTVSGGLINKSEDGVVFTQDNVGDAATFCYAISASESRVVTVGVKSSTSLDAITWTPGEDFIFGQIGFAQCIANDGFKFIACSNINSVISTLDGVSWVAITSPFGGTSAIRAIDHDPVTGRWAMVNANGLLAYSDSATNGSWTVVDLGVQISVNGALKGYAGRWAASVAPNAILYSNDNCASWGVASEGFSISTRGIINVRPAGGGLPVRLSTILEWCHRRVGQSSDHFDATELDDELDGVVFADGYTARDAITTLLPIYNADASEHDRGIGYRINYIKRGKPVVRTLTIDDLVDEPEETVREDPMERPRVLHMAFESPVTGYTAGKASIQRLSPDVKLVNEVSTYVPVTFKNVDEAWQKADVQMRVAWTEVHGERKFSIPDSHIDLVPTDNVALSLRGQVQRLRLLKNEYADGVLKLESVADRQSNYTSHVTGIPLPAPEKPPPSLMGPAALAILDIPAVSDQHDRLGYYVAVTGTADAFAGAVVQRQQNGAWADVVSIGRSQRATMGVLENAVSAGSEHYTDTTNTVSVTLYMDAELESLSNAQWLNKGGAFALETATGWEIMQYRDAYQDSDGVWHLTHLARGRLNTGPDEHLPGSRFVMLSGAQFIDADVGMIDQPLTLRAAAVGRSPETAVPETITYQGNSQREFPLAHLLSDGIEGGEITVQLVPRHRFGTEDHPVRSVNWTGYRLHASVVVAQQTVDTLADEYTFTVPGPASGIAITAGQTNRYTGLGPTTSETYLK